MSNRKKLPKKKETSDYTIDNFIEDEAQKWANHVDVVRSKAFVEGKYGVMVIGTERAFICEHVPYGRIMHAGSEEAYEKFVASKEQ